MRKQIKTTDVCCDIQGAVEVLGLLSNGLFKEGSKYCCIPGTLINALDAVCDKLDEMDLAARKEGAA